MVELEDQTNSDVAYGVFTEANQHKSKMYNRVCAKRSEKLKDLEFTGLQNVRLVNLSMANHLQLDRQISR